MALRMYTQGARIIISRPGFNASPSLDNNNKIFDSAWDFSNTYLEGGSATDPYWLPGQGLPSQDYPITIMFKKVYTFVPAAIVVASYNTSAGIQGLPLGTVRFPLDGWGANSMIYNDRIVLRRYPDGSRWQAAEFLDYHLFSVQ